MPSHQVPLSGPLRPSDAVAMILHASPPDELPFEIPDPRDCPELMLANEAFLRDLPELLAHHRDEFVLYQGGQQLGISVSPWPLETQCGALQAGTAAVFWIREQDDPGEDMTPAF